MHEDKASVEDGDDYVQKIAYWTVYSGDTRSAGAVTALVKEKVEEMYENE